MFAPADALDTATDYVAGKLANAFGAALPSAVPRAHDYYNGVFVAPAGAAGDKDRAAHTRRCAIVRHRRARAFSRWRAGHRGSAFGRDAGGARGAGLLETIREPVTKAADYITDGGKVTVRDAAGYLAGNSEKWSRTSSTLCTQPTSRTRCARQICKAQPTRRCNEWRHTLA